MRVLSVVSILSAREGGGNAERTAQLTRAIARTGVTCTVLTLDIGDVQARRSQLGGAELVALPCLNKRFQIPQPQWRKVVELVRRADVVHLMGYWSLLGVMVSVAAARAGVPYVICPAGALPLFGRSTLLKKAFNRLVGYRLVARASGWIAVTSSELPDFEAYGIAPNKVEIISNGVVESDFDSSDGTALPESKGLESGPFILFMGRLNSIKGPDLLLEAFIQVAADFPDVKLVFAGPDEGLQGALEQRVQVVGLSGRVRFLGFVGLQDKVAAYRAASLLVVPSRKEAMSLVAVEGGICETPVLMTDQCGLDEVCEIDAGLVVAPSGDALAAGLRRALSDRERLRSWGVRWQSLVRDRFLWRDLGQRFANYLDVVARRGRG